MRSQQTHVRAALARRTTLPASASKTMRSIPSRAPIGRLEARHACQDDVIQRGTSRDSQKVTLQKRHLRQGHPAAPYNLLWREGSPARVVPFRKSREHPHSVQHQGEHQKMRQGGRTTSICNKSNSLIKIALSRKIDSHCVSLPALN